MRVSEGPPDVFGGRKRRRWTRPRLSLPRVTLAALLALAVWACLHWPRVNDVETGVSAHYPELRPRQYTMTEGQLIEATARAVRRLPGWQWVGSGSGPKGGEVRAVVTLPIVSLQYDVIVRTSRHGGKTQLSIRSKSRALPWDFGQNARNIRELLAAIEKES